MPNINIIHIQSCKFDSEAIEMIKEVGKRSPNYAKFARIDDL